MTYILYKHPVELTTLHIVQYLYFMGHDSIPLYCVERNFPLIVTEVPAIHDTVTEQWYLGLDRCIEFYKEKAEDDELMSHVKEFKERYPDFRINDRISRPILYPPQDF